GLTRTRVPSRTDRAHFQDLKDPKCLSSKARTASLVVGKSDITANLVILLLEGKVSFRSRTWAAGPRCTPNRLQTLSKPRASGSGLSVCVWAMPGSAFYFTPRAEVPSLTKSIRWITRCSTNRSTTWTDLKLMKRAYLRWLEGVLSTPYLALVRSKSNTPTSFWAKTMSQEQMLKRTEVPNLSRTKST